MSIKPIRISLKGLQRLFLILILVFLSGALGYGLGRGQISLQAVPMIDRAIPTGKPEDFSLFWQTWDDLKRLYVDRASLNDTQLVYGAIKGMVAAAGDPYTQFLTPAENKETKQDLQGSFGGVGIELGYKDQNLAVLSSLAGTPAQKAGLRAGDIIVKITDQGQGVDREAANMSLAEAVSLIRGKVGTQVVLTIVRQGVDKPFTVSLTREVISVKTVEVKVESVNCPVGVASSEGGCQVPVIRVSRFGETTDKEWDAAVTQVQGLASAHTLAGVVLDLRDDPGGYLDQAVNLASDFITSGVVVWQQGIDGRTSYSVTRSARLAGVRLVVLINGGSASAAEIMAGALKEKAGAVLVGEKSFGKGSVQEAEDLPGGAGLHVTVAKWLLPSGKSIDKVGITPDVVVAADQNDQTKDPQLARALQLVTHP